MKIIFFLITLALLFNLGNWLDLTGDPKKSDLIVVLGGGKEARIKKGLELYLLGYSNSKKILFTGSDLYDEVLPLFYRKQYLVSHGVKESNIIQIDEKHISNTMEELFAVKAYMQEHHMHHVLFVSHPTHTRRIEILANMIAHYNTSNIQISFAAADHTNVWNKNLYFFNLVSIKLVFSEVLKIFYNLVKYTVLLEFTHF